MADIANLARYAVLDPDADSTILEICLDAAKEWFKGAGVEERTDSKLYDIGVYMLATHYYDRRGVVADGAVEMIPLGVQSIMHQLRL